MLRKAVIVVLLASILGTLARRNAPNDPWLRVDPSTPLTIHSVALGEEETLSWRVENVVGGPVELIVVEKSCGCIEASVNPEIIDTGEVAVVIARVAVPLSGERSGSMILEARPRPRASDLLARTTDSRLRLEFSIQPDLSARLLTVPGAVMLDPKRISTTVTLSCRWSSRSRPAVVLAYEGSDEVPIQTLTPWNSVGSGTHAAILSLEIARSLAATARSLSIVVTDHDGESASSILQVR
ncbi:MAG: hypothetical protein AB7I09_20665 [Planctomycetota bacterium]